VPSVVKGHSRSHQQLPQRPLSLVKCQCLRAVAAVAAAVRHAQLALWMAVSLAYE
jgi:hypothetical protein